MTEAENAQIGAELTQFMEGTVADVRNLDIEHYLTHYRRGDDLTFVYNGDLTRSWDGLAELKRGVWGGIASVEAFDYDMHTQVMSANAGVATMTFNITATLTTGDALQGRGSFTAVLGQDAGQWMIINAAEFFEPAA